MSTALVTRADRGDPPTAEERVERARRAAERAAAAHTAVDAVDEAPSDEETSRQTGLRKLGELFGPLELSALPRDWSRAGLSLDEAEVRNGELVQTLSNGLEVTFTIEPEIQQHLERVYERRHVPHGGAVLVEPSTGRILAMVSHTDGGPRMRHLARKATAPSASVFKIVTSAALLEENAVSPHDETCYHGGHSGLDADNIKGNPRLDHKCADLEKILAWSINSAIAKLAYRHLSKEEMQRWARRFGYRSELPFELPVETSTADIASEGLERARIAAGFWHTYLSPLHGAMIGATLANDGVMMQPSIIERVETPSGRVLQQFDPEPYRRVVSKQTADTLAQLVQKTTRDGTADDYFQHRARFPNDVTTGGKTGTLANHDPYLSFTWFVGYGYHDANPEHRAAIGALAANKPTWHIKGPYVASEALRMYFETTEPRARRDSKDGEEMARASE
jgi:cell division protein FtsI/penicillin-binding protein 2